MIGYQIILFLHLFLVFRFMSLRLKYSICLESIRRVFMIGSASRPTRFANFPLKYAILKTQRKISKTGPFGLFHYWYQLCAHIRTANIISGENRGFDILVQSNKFSCGGALVSDNIDTNKSIIKKVFQAVEKYSNPGRAFHCLCYNLAFQFLSTRRIYQR